MKIIHSLANNENKQSWATLLRKKRVALLLDLLQTAPKPVKILDIGGTEHFWQMMDFVDQPDIYITLLNLEGVGTSYANFTSVLGDATKMPQFAENEFDVVFSNSVIEHVGNFAKQHMMAREVCRVGKRYFVQTPNYYFPIEPHVLLPAFHWLPISWRAALVQQYNLGWIGKIGDPQEAREVVESIHLLKRKQFMALFPEADLYEERVFGLIKSFVVFGGW